MKDETIAAISNKLKEIYPDRIIYLDPVIQSTKDFYLVLPVTESGAENVEIDIQNVSFLIDIALTDNKSDRNLTNKLVSRCGASFNMVTIDERMLLPKAYLPDEAGGVQHIRFTPEFPQYVEWSER